MRRSRTKTWLVAALVLSLFASPAVADDPDEPLRPLAEDPLGLLPGIDVLRQYTSGTDTMEVWTCALEESAASFVSELNTVVRPWFVHHSRGRYVPEFVVGGDIPAPEVGVTCTGQIAAASDGTAQAMLEFGSFGIGFGSPGYSCGFQICPGSQAWGWTRRNAQIPPGSMGVAAHEIGHMLRWQHSFVTREPDPDIPMEYDNVMDLMSGMWAPSDEPGVVGGTSDVPYGTAVINQYAAGWIDPSEVYVMSGDGATFNLTTVAGEGYQMAVIKQGNSFYTLGARVRGGFDPIPAPWQGVEAFRVIACPLGGDGTVCEDHEDYGFGFRRVIPEPAIAADLSDDDLFDKRPPHVLGVGEVRQVGGVDVTVVATIPNGYRISVGPDPTAIPDPVRPRFTDTGGHVFEADIDWLAAEGVTKGCNPPVNDQFCPDASVTRGQMAAFLVRALSLSEVGPGFADTGGHVFAGDISRLAAAGITKGCNPPSNTRFCPDDVVTRGQMAAFLRRALG